MGLRISLFTLGAYVSVCVIYRCLYSCSLFMCCFQSYFYVPDVRY